MFSLKKRKRIILLTLICFSLVALVFASSSIASVGHSTSHSSSSSSHSSSSSSSHSSSSSGSSSSSSTSHNSTSSSNPSSGFLGGLLGMLFFIPFLFILIVIIVIVMIVKRKGGSTSYSGVDEDYGEEGPPDHDPAQVSAALDELKARDENFSEDMFISRVNNMFIQLQEAWQEKDWKKVRPFESDELFNMHAKQLQDYIRANQTNIVAEIAILKTEIVGCHEDGATESLDIYMRTRFKDYVIDDETKKVVEGDPHRENYMEYLLVMARKKGVMTKVEQNTTVSTCPNCGANVSINASGECEYCGSVVSNGDFDWVLTRMDVISQS